MNTANFINQHNRYPISTQTLDFLQEQIKLVYNLCDLFGKNYILREPTAVTLGLIVIEGELMPLMSGTERNYIAVREESMTITASGTDFPNARINRYAEYTDIDEGEDCFLSTSFSSLTTISQLIESIAEAREHTLPKGAIIDYYRLPTCHNVPRGFVPCGYYTPLSSMSMEISAWTALFSDVSTEILDDNPRRSARLRITRCNGIDIPDMTDRFTVVAGDQYTVGDTGGSDSVKLTATQSGLPSHRHQASFNTYNPSGGAEETNRFGRGNGDKYVQVLNTSFAGGFGAEQAHENRPPYYALYKLIKVI